jgi:hypothetical protein
VSSSVDVARVAYNAGFRGQALVNMVALALSESGGNPNSLNDNPKTGDYSVGLWQINYFGGLADSRTKSYGAPAALRGVDIAGPEAAANAKAAFTMSGGGQNLNPWKADFNNGSYYKNLPAAVAAVTSLLGGPVSPGATGSPGGTFAGGTNNATGVTTLASVTSNEAKIAAEAATDSDCLLKLPSVVGIGGGCIMTRGQMRGIFAIGVLAAGGIVLLVGAALMVTDTKSISTAVGGIVGGPPGAVVGSVVGSKGAADRHAAKAPMPDAGQKARAAQAFKGTPFTASDGVVF